MTEHDYFDRDGHLTDEALQDLIYGEPDELSRLEIAEHLSFCDRCTERYTALLCGDVLVDPPEPLAQGVLQRIRHQARVIFLNRYVAAGAAACFAMVFWITGVFQFNLPQSKPKPGWEVLDQITSSVSERWDQFGQGVADGVSEFFEKFDWKGVFHK